MIDDFPQVASIAFTVGMLLLIVILVGFLATRDDSCCLVDLPGIEGLSPVEVFLRMIAHDDSSLHA